MNTVKKYLIPAISLTGALIVGWIAAGFVGHSPLALFMTVLIAAVFAMGMRELQQFRVASDALHAALAAVPQPLVALDVWLAQVPAGLQNSVRLRVEGERNALPGPSLTPYLAGLLVMLGMLGTFLGMVLTFKGAVFALEGSGDLQAVRAALTAPIKGLGLSFGTSVAGVATSALLGLASALCRRERLQVARLLDYRIAHELRPFSLAHQREESLKALQAQSQALPGVAAQLQRLMEQLEQRHLALNTQLDNRQVQLQQSVTQAYTQLAQTVGRSLQESLLAGAKQASDAIVPIVESAMQHLSSQTQSQQKALRDTLDTQLQEVIHSYRASMQTLGADWSQALGQSTSQLQADWQHTNAQAAARQNEICQALEASAATITTRTTEQAATVMEGIAALLQQAQGLLNSQREAEVTWTQQQHARMDAMAALWRTELAALRDDESARGEAAAGRLTALTTQLRTDMARLDERDTQNLQERQHIMERLQNLLQSAEHTMQGQRGAIDTLVATASRTLEHTQQEFAMALARQSDRAEGLSTQVSHSAQELSQLGTRFHEAVALFAGTSEQLVQSLRGVEAALGQSLERSDEQLAYYVGQAREVIDLSLSSQQAVVESLRTLRRSETTPGTV